MKSIKRLFPYLKAYRGTIILTLTLGLILSTITLGVARMVKMIGDEIFVAKNPRMLAIAPFIIVGIYLVSGILRFAHMYLLRYTGEKIGFDIRGDLQAHYANVSLDFHNENSSGSLISKTINDVISVQLGLGLLADVVREPISALAMLAYLFFMNWRLTLMTFVAAPVLILASRSLGRSVRKYSQSMQEIWELFTTVLKETVDGIRIIKAFSLEKHMQEKFRATANRMLAVRSKILSREEMSGPVFELLAAITFAGILYYAGYQAIHGRFTNGDFMAFAFLLGSLQGPIKKLQDTHVRMQHTVAAAKRIFEILDTPITVKSPEDMGRKSVPWPQKWEFIEFHDVHFSYGSKSVLKGINLRVQRGEVVAIVGTSGAGKTTLVNLVPRFYDVTRGKIEIEGVDIRDMRIHDLRAHIGLVTQDVFLFNESIKANILAGKENAPEERVREVIEAAHASTFIERMALKWDSMVGDRGSRLSGGERQRISIARALFRDTPILILDEATSSLDSESEKIVQVALEELMRGRTTFVIAHRLSTIQQAHRIVVLADGQIIEQGNHAELLEKHGAYHRLHTTQFGAATV